MSVAFGEGNEELGVDVHVAAVALPLVGGFRA